MPLTQEHITAYSNFVGQPLSERDADGNKYVPESKQKARELIKEAHQFVTIWAASLRNVICPHGSFPDKQIRATNQVGNFRDYLPQTFYPDRSYPSNLMYWVYLWVDRSTPENKIFFKVTLGLNDDTIDKSLKKFFKDYKQRQFSSTECFTSHLPAEEGVKLTLQEITDWAVKSINNFPATYEEIKSALEPLITNDDLKLEAKKFSGFWVEKCAVKQRIDREQGPYSLGKVLWSPQKSANGSDIYSNMREVKSGDIIIHLTDNLSFSGVSKVKKEADFNFKCLENTDWAGAPGYLIELEEYQELTPSIERENFFAARDILLNLLDSSHNIFYNSKLNFREGAYLTEAPLGLIKYLNKLYFQKSGENLPFINSDIISQSEQQPEEKYDASTGLFISEEDFFNATQLLKSKKNLILQGPPGVGKSFLAKRIAYALLGGKYLDRVNSVQFHQSYTYEDFIQGYRPKKDSSGFYLKNGVFYTFCEKASKDLNNSYVFIIDEINRGNLSKIFGEVMLLIETDKRSDELQNEWAVSLTYSDENSKDFSIPRNVHILGMMNTADRSLAIVDYALRRRFAFLSLEPAFNSDAFHDFLELKGVTEEIILLLKQRIQALNLEIEKSLDLGSGFKIGHSYFVPSDNIADSREWYESIVKNEIAPLLKEYWFDKKIEDIEKTINNLLS
jgi:hypothetical protein